MTVTAASAPGGGGWRQLLLWLAPRDGGAAAAERLRGWAESAQSAAAARLAELSPDARWLVLGSVAVLGANLVAMAIG